MELDGKCRHIVVGDALAGAVVDIDKCLLRALRQRIAQYLIAVVLTADVDASGRQILDRLVRTSVTEFHLSSLRALGNRQQLVSQADAEHRFSSLRNLSDLLDDLRVVLWVAWTVGKHDPVRIHCQNLLRRRTCRKVSHAASAPGQLADDIFLCAKIPEHNLELFFLIRRFDLTFLWCNGFNRLCNVEVFHFLQLFRIIRRLHLGQPAVHRTGFTNGFCQLSRIDSIDARDVSFFKKGVKIPTASEVGRFLTPLFYDIG